MKAIVFDLPYLEGNYGVHFHYKPAIAPEKEAFVVCWQAQTAIHSHIPLQELADILPISAK